MSIDEAYIQKFVNAHNYDIRITHNGRFTDQKCIPDVVNAVAECILEFINDDVDKKFTKNDIWHSDFSNQLIEESFSKPDTENKTMKLEYDKFFAQPMKMLATAGVLIEDKEGNSNVYCVKEKDILEYISAREKNALIFLDIYLTKVMNDSCCYHFFEAFFEKQDQNTFNALRDALTNLYKKYTNIKEELEPPRIFNKIINILAFRRRKKGSVRGGLSKYPITIEEIRYNRINWRDVGKSKGLSRQEYESNEGIDRYKYSGYYERAVNKAKKFVRNIEPYSEVHRYPMYKATDAHHIFMKSEFPQLADMPENIIALTATEHYAFAHPDHDTHRTDADYQMICLISKLDSIERNVQNKLHDYSLEDFVEVLNTGLKTNTFDVNMGFELIKATLLRFHKSSGMEYPVLDDITTDPYC